MTIYHAVIHTMTEAGTIPHGFLTVENGKITCVQSGDPDTCLLYTSPSPRDLSTSRMPSSA